jgi:hypothetical protein
LWLLAFCHQNFLDAFARHSPTVEDALDCSGSCGTRTSLDVYRMTPIVAALRTGSKPPSNNAVERASRKLRTRAGAVWGARS